MTLISEVSSIPFDANNPNFIDATIQMTRVIDSTSLIQLGDSNTQTDLFQYELSEPRRSQWQAYPDNFKFTGIDISLDQDITSVSRNTYDFVGFLGDMGGLYDALMVIGTWMVYPFAKTHQSNILMTKLFKVRKSTASTDFKSRELDHLRLERQQMKRDFN